MPKVTLEILRTVTLTRDERIEVEADVPDHVLDDPDALHEWVEAELDKTDSDLTQATVGNWGIESVHEDSATVDEVTNLDES